VKQLTQLACYRDRHFWVPFSVGSWCCWHMTGLSLSFDLFVVNGWMGGRMGRMVGGWTDGWVNVWMDGWMDGWACGWTDGWMGGWVEGQMSA
jgi:hypothetical protein